MRSGAQRAIPRCRLPVPDRARLTEPGDGQEDPGFVAIAGHRDRGDTQPVDGSDQRAVRQGSALHHVHGDVGEHRDEFVAREGEGAGDHRTLGHQFTPGARRRVVEGGGDDPAPGRTERRDTDQSVAAEDERRSGLHADMDVAPGSPLDIVQEQVDMRPAAHRRDQQVLAVGRALHIGPGLPALGVVPEQRVGVGSVPIRWNHTARLYSSPSG
ncbi:MAG: hypothetical protein R2715_02600 [Ilumatobacteraceae bacterium]